VTRRTGAQSSSTGEARTPISLAQAVDRALQHYPSVRVAVARIQQAHANVRLAKTQYLPSSNMLWQINRATFNNTSGQLLPQAVVSPISGPVTSRSGASAWGSAAGVLMSWQPFDFGLRHANVLQARSGETIAEQAANLTRLDIAQATATAFLTVVAEQEAVKAAEANHSRWETFDKSIHVLTDNQLRPGVDASQADAEMAAALTQLIQTQTNLKLARAALAELLGVSETAFDVLPEAVLQLPPDPVGSPAPLDQHPRALQQKASVGLADDQLRSIRRSYAPDLYLEGAVSGRGSGIDPAGRFLGGPNGLGLDRENWAVGVNLTFDPMQYFMNRAQREAATGNVAAQKALYDQTITELQRRMLQAESQLEGARQIARNTPLQLAAARDSERQSVAQYKAGLATVVQVAEAESLLTAAEIADSQAKLEVWRSLVDVSAARGDLQPVMEILRNQPKPESR